MNVKVIDSMNNPYSEYNEVELYNNFNEKIYFEKEIYNFIKDKKIINISYSVSIESHKTINVHHHGDEHIEVNQLRSCIILYETEEL